MVLGSTRFVIMDNGSGEAAASTATIASIAVMVHATAARVDQAAKMIAVLPAAQVTQGNGDARVTGDSKSGRTTTAALHGTIMKTV
jgi:hypothetical protein